MNTKHKRLTVQFAHELQVKMADLMLKTFGKEESDTSDLINLILSSHLSSAFTCMKLISNDNKEISKEVNNFIDKITNYISSLEMIREIQKL